MKFQKSEVGAQRSEPSIELHIEELVLHGFEPGESYVIGDALEREFARLLADCGVPGGLGQPREIETVDAGSVRLPRLSQPSGVGAHVASAIYERLRQ